MLIQAIACVKLGNQLFFIGDHLINSPAIEWFRLVEKNTRLRVGLVLVAARQYESRASLKILFTSFVSGKALIAAGFKPTKTGGQRLAAQSDIMQNNFEIALE